MTDFYAILKNAIAESGARDGEHREKLYGRARGMLSRQLESMQPPMSSEARQEQRAALENAVRRIEAEFAGRAAATAPPPKPAATSAGAASSPAKDGAAAPVPPRSAGDAAAAADAGEAKRRGVRGAGLVALLLLLLVVVGGGALAYWRWDAVEPRLADLTEVVASRLGIDTADTPPAVAPDRAGEEGAAPGTSSDSLPPREFPAPAGESSPLPKSDRVTAAPPPEPAPLAQAPSAPEPPGSASREPGSQDAPLAGEPSPADDDKDQARIPPAALATERAYLIIEQAGEDNNDLRLAGTALWSVAGAGADASLAVAVGIPERSGEFRVVIRLNNDASLPASHTIDVVYRGGDDPDGSITNVSNFLVRVENSDSTVPLRSAGALVVPGQFLIGLSNTAVDRAQNISLLKKATWIVVQAQFESKKRSLFVIEKGESGSEAMAKAFAAWEQAASPSPSPGQ